MADPRVPPQYRDHFDRMNDACKARVCKILDEIDALRASRTPPESDETSSEDRVAAPRRGQV